MHERRSHFQPRCWQTTTSETFVCFLSKEDSSDLCISLLIQNSIEILKKYALFVKASSHELGLFRYLRTHLGELWTRLSIKINLGGCEVSGCMWIEQTGTKGLRFRLAINLWPYSRWPDTTIPSNAFTTFHIWYPGDGPWSTAIPCGQHYSFMSL